MNPALVTPSAFCMGFVTGFIVRKYWFLIRTILGLKRSRPPVKEKALATNPNSKASIEESENLEADSLKIVALNYFKLFQLLQSSFKINLTIKRIFQNLTMNLKWF